MEYSVVKYDITTPQNPATELCLETQSSFQLSVLMSFMNAGICLVIFISVRLSSKSLYTALFP